MKLSTFLFLLGCALVIIFAVTHSAHAQPVITNISVTPFVESGVTPPSPSAASVKIAQDIYQLVLDVLTSFGGMSAGSAGLGAYLVLKFLRTRTPLGTNPKIAPWLNVLNLEAKGDFAQPVPQPQPAAETANKP